MEAILNSLAVENQKICIAWKQILCAVFLALFVVGLYAYVSSNVEIQPESKKAVMGETSLDGLAQIIPAIDAVSALESERIFTENSLLTQKEIAVEPVKIKETPRTKVNEKPKMTVAEDQKEKLNDQSSIKEMTDIANISESEKAIISTVPLEEDKIENSPVISEISIELYGNGGTPECITDSCKIEEFEIGEYKQPERLGKLFDGWYCDKEGTAPFTKIQSGESVIKLYAGWKEFPGLLCNDKGYITGYTKASAFLGDGLASLPTHDSCKGITKNALKGLEDDIIELYIPANIIYIESGSFDYLSNLFYIEVSSKNPAYYSKEGCVYSKDGKLIASPSGWE